MAVTIDQIKKLRSQTGAGIMDCRTALEESKGDVEKALAYLKKRGLEKAAKKADRETNAGLVYSYIHGGGQIGAMIEIACETDFVARTDDFENLCKEIAMQVASMNPASVEELLEQAYIREPKRKVNELVTGAIAKLGENIGVKRIVRFELGSE